MSGPSAAVAPARIELDTASVAPVSATAQQAWQAAVQDGWADERGLHGTAARSRLLLDSARGVIAELLLARPEDVAFPPDHVRAVHAGVLGCGAPGVAADAPVVVSALEHSSVHHAAAWASRVHGAEVRTVPVDSSGHVDLDALRAALPGARLACVQHANVEIATVQDLSAVQALCRETAVPLLVDAAASLGHLPTPTDGDVLIASPRAWGSVAGAAVLLVRAGVRWRAHEPGEAGASRRPGEHGGQVDVAAAVAAAVSLKQVLTGALGAEDPRHALVDRIRDAAAAVPDTVVVGDPVRRLPHVLTMSALYVPGEELLRGLDREGFSVGSGSACTSDTLAPSHVLAAVGALTHGNVRLGLPRGTRAADVERFCAVLPRVVAEVRELMGVTDL